MFVLGFWAVVLFVVYAISPGLIAYLVFVGLFWVVLGWNMRRVARKGQPKTAEVKRHSGACGSCGAIPGQRHGQSCAKWAGLPYWS